MLPIPAPQRRKTDKTTAEGRQAATADPSNELGSEWNLRVDLFAKPESSDWAAAFRKSTLTPFPM